MAEPEAANSRNGNMKKIGEFIKDLDFTMMTTVDEEGELQSRPMSTQKAEFDGDIYFFTYDDSHKAQHIKSNPRVNLAYAAPEKQDYLSIKGDAQILTDREKMEELWQPQLKAWFPQELETPGICLIKVNAKTAEYWDSPSSTTAHVIGLVKSTLTGQAQPVGDDVTVIINE